MTSVYSFNIFTAQGHVKTWVPQINNELTELNVVDVSGNDSYKLCLTQEGQVLIHGMVAWMDPRTYSTPTSITPQVPNAKVVAMSSTTELFAILLSDGSVFACGNTFSPTLVQICEKGIAQKIAVTKHRVLISTGKTLVTFFNQSSVNTIYLGERTVQCISTYEPGFLVLLDDGILYCTFPVRDLGQKIESRIAGLYIVSGFLGPQMIHMETSLDEIVCVYRDGSIVYGWADQEHTCPYPVLSALPVFPPDKSQLCHLHISRDLIWLLTSYGDVYYISKLPWLDPENGRIARFKKVPITFPCRITHFRATWNEIYFFKNGNNHKPIVTNISIESLPTRRLPFTVHTSTRGSILVDPLGASALGLRPGDVIKVNNDPLIVIGRSGDVLCVKDAQVDRSIDVIPLPDIATILFTWQLISRPDASIGTYITKKDDEFEVDCSENGLQRICFFKFGDLIVDRYGTKYSVIGERCECLWIKNEDGEVIMCKHCSCQALHREFKLESRLGYKVWEKKNVKGGIILVEPAPDGPFHPNCLIKSPRFGIGKYIGCASLNYAIEFVMDCGYCRLVNHAHPLEIIRSPYSLNREFYCLSGNSIFLDVIEPSPDNRQKSDIRPCDVIYHSGEKVFGFCVSSQNGLYFETEIMIKNSMGVAPFDDNSKVSVVARISGAATIKKKNIHKEIIELSINSDDFRDFPLLPLDVIKSKNRLAYVCGCVNNQLYVVYQDSPKYVEKLPDKFELIYRRLNVPTKKTVKIEGEKETGWIDLEHFRSKGFLPYDEFQWHNETLRILAIVNDNSIIVMNTETKEKNVFVIPIGLFITPTKSVF
ncbi:hypothetical protein TRFO_21250 [Tritrichomonas foetus]|uniref:Uncharacterized protein n=1 Tax=Tritrichomonas foetus TaxID=1144522 RepID=A0A1J4KE76_9EUKA|nr:hypothetical protein TRFO_21250 [Tritrichomonas foetus]|eukprot:OHT09735.1 hypothetical protein TRFO_21250 [Tritrichomonas foetus]